LPQQLSRPSSGADLIWAWRGGYFGTKRVLDFAGLFPTPFTVKGVNRSFQTKKT